MKNFRISILPIILMALISLFLTLLIGELGVRFIFGKKTDANSIIIIQGESETGSTYHDLLGWVNTPNIQYNHKSLEFDIEVRINDKGVRSDKEYPYKNDTGNKRIVIVGDSFTFGHGVNNDETYSSILERLLLDIEVINLGVSAYGTDQQLLMLRERGLKYNPDIVILGLYKGDVFRNAQLFHGTTPKPMFQLNRNGELVLINVPVPKEEDIDWNNFEKSKIQKHSKLYNLILQRGSWFLQHIGFGKSWKITEEILREMKTVVEESGAKFIVLVIPTSGSIYGNSLEKNIQNQTISNIREILDSNDIRYIDLLPTFNYWAENNRVKRLYFKKDGHFSPSGHQVVAERIRDILEEKR